MNISILPRVGDILAIPFFLWLSIYFIRLYKKRGLTIEEKILTLFSIGGLICDLIFVFYIDSKGSRN
jgi:hypothetical protein